VVFIFLERRPTGQDHPGMADHIVSEARGVPYEYENVRPLSQICGRVRGYGQIQPFPRGEGGLEQFGRTMDHRSSVKRRQNSLH